ncbi:MAG: hypothetical protein GQ574_03940 [Crocinitomix sp.]|nr:hypothetical protein [Crocinitomix sp.]
MNTIKIFIGSNGKEPSEMEQLFEGKFDAKAIEFVHGNDKFKRNCNYFLYVFTPTTEGIKTIINVVNDSNRFKSKVIFLVLNEADEFTPHQVKSLIATGKMVELNGGKWFDKLETMIEFLENK